MINSHHSSKHVAVAFLATGLFLGLFFPKVLATPIIRIATLSQQEYKPLVQSQSTEPDTYYNRGLFLQGEGNLNGALEQFNQALALSPNDPDFYFSRGLTYTDLGDHQRAIQDFSKALAIDPTFAAAYFQRGMSSMVIPVAQVSNPASPRFSADYDPKVVQAIQDFSKAIALNSEFVAAYYFRGLAHHIRGQEHLANKDYRQARQLNPSLIQAHYEEGFPQNLVGGD